MKQVLKVMIIVLCLATSFVSKAIATDEITLTVSSDGPTKDDAVKNALRTAIEQAYGAFVSANTTILNDELVKDEIVTVSNGSIKEYKIVSEYQKADGTGYGVTANTNVSLPNLITYAKSHGSECEFAGNTFGMEIRLFNLQKENELKAISNLIPAVKELCRTTMAWSMKIDEPFILQKKEREFSINDIILDQRCVKDLFAQIPTEAKSAFSDIFTEPQKYCVIHLELSWTRIGTENRVANYLYNAFSKIGLDKMSFANMESKGLDVSSFRKNTLWLCTNGEEGDGYTNYYFRNDRETMIKALMEINSTIRQEKLKFQILDNNGDISEFKIYEYVSLIGDTKNLDKKARISVGVFRMPDSNIYFSFARSRYSDWNWVINGSGLFKNLFLIKSRDIEDCFDWMHRDREECRYVFDDYKKIGAEKDYQLLSDAPSFSIYVIMPLSEIGKYSSFKIEPKE